MASYWKHRSGWTGWRREFGWALIALGALSCCGSAIPSVRLPLLDPTPAMLEKEAIEQHRADVILGIGAAVAVVMFSAGIWFVVLGRIRARRDRAGDG